MNWISWTLPALILLPLAGGVLAGVIPGERTRNTLISCLALLITIGGVAAVYGSAQCPGGVWSLSVPGWTAYAGTVLELLIIGVILAVSLKIKNAWIALLSVLQLVGVGGTFFLHGDHSSK